MLIQATIFSDWNKSTRINRMTKWLCVFIINCVFCFNPRIVWMWIVYRIVTRTKWCVCERLCLLLVDLGLNYLFSDQEKILHFHFIKMKFCVLLYLGVVCYEWVVFSVELKLNFISPIFWNLKVCNSLFWHLNSFLIFCCWCFFSLFTFQFNSAYGIYINLLYETRRMKRPTRMHLQMDTTISLCVHSVRCIVVWVSFHLIASHLAVPFLFVSFLLFASK